MKERAKLWIKCAVDEKQRAAAMRTCAHGNADMPGYLFWLIFFAWIYEPRNPYGMQKLPFFPHPYQIRELKTMYDCIMAGEGIQGKKFIELWLKSRDMGLTWLVLAIFVWFFLFHKKTFHVGSRNEKEVDYLGEVKTLFFKCRYLINQGPQWMKPEGLEDKVLLLSYQNGEVGISGESANADFATGNRKAAVLADEFSKWEHDRSAYRSMNQTTNCIFLVGTPKGYGNFYSELARGKTKIKLHIHRVHWTEHPLKTTDLEYIDGVPTSSWYRKECDSMEDDMIGGELDLSFESSLKGIVFGGVYGTLHQKKKLKPVPGVPILRCWDLGGIGAVIWLQYDKYRRFRILKELVTEGLPLLQLADEVLAVSERLEKFGCTVLDANGSPFVQDTSDWYTWEDCGDPAGASMSKTNQAVPEYDELFSAKQINVEYLYMATLPTNIRVRARIVSIEDAMKRVILQPGQEGLGFWVDVDECPILDEALRGGYRRKLDKNNTVLDAIDERHPYEDVVDALGYGVVYKAGVPDKLKKEQQKKTEEEIEDEDDDMPNGGVRTRC